MAGLLPQEGSYSLSAFVSPEISQCLAGSAMMNNKSLCVMVLEDKEHQFLRTFVM
jgi:hypothetical protein